MVDCGSNSNEAIDYLNKHNVKSIIIDHHEINKPYPESNVMVRNDRQRCKKIIYTTKYDQWGWFTRRTIQPLRSCWKHNNNRRHHHHPTVNPQLKIIIK